MIVPARLGQVPVWRGLDEVPAGWGPCVVTRVPAAGRYTARLTGSRRVELQVTIDGQILVDPAKVLTARASVDFLDRLED